MNVATVTNNSTSLTQSTSTRRSQTEVKASILNDFTKNNSNTLSRDIQAAALDQESILPLRSHGSMEKFQLTTLPEKKNKKR